MRREVAGGDGVLFFCIFMFVAEIKAARPGWAWRGLNKATHRTNQIKLVSVFCSFPFSVLTGATGGDGSRREHIYMCFMICYVFVRGGAWRGLRGALQFVQNKRIL